MRSARAPMATPDRPRGFLTRRSFRPRTRTCRGPWPRSAGQKKTRRLIEGRASFSGTLPSSDRANVLRLQALRALGNLELHLLALGEGAEPFGVDRSVVAENVLAPAVLRDEAETLR